MPKRNLKLALVMAATVAFGLVLNVALIVLFARPGHVPYGSIAALTAFMPAAVIGVLAWQGRLPSCRRAQVTILR